MHTRVVYVAPRRTLVRDGRESHQSFAAQINSQRVGLYEDIQAQVEFEIVQNVRVGHILLDDRSRHDLFGVARSAVNMAIAIARWVCLEFRAHVEPSGHSLE